jgi:biotin transport system substrate-specific component
MLTIGGTLLRASIAGIPFGSSTIPFHFLGVSYQIGAVMLVGCLGGRNAAAMSQIAYLALGLAGFPVFSKGGGIHYLQEPSFGYLIGFIPGAWVCGYLAFRTQPRLETLALSSVLGLSVIHLVGIFYLFLSYAFKWVDTTTVSLGKAFITYSVNLLPGQLAVTCAISVFAYFLRRIMFY